MASVPVKRLEQPLRHARARVDVRMYVDDEAHGERHSLSEFGSFSFVDVYKTIGSKWFSIEQTQTGAHTAWAVHGLRVPFLRGSGR